MLSSRRQDPEACRAPLRMHTSVAVLPVHCVQAVRLGAGGPQSSSASQSERRGIHSLAALAITFFSCAAVALSLFQQHSASPWQSAFPV